MCILIGINSVFNKEHIWVQQDTNHMSFKVNQDLLASVLRMGRILLNEHLQTVYMRLRLSLKLTALKMSIS